MKNTNQITDLTIPADALDFWMVADLINTLSGRTGADDAMAALEDWAAENAVAFALKYANDGNADDAAALLEIYDGDGQDDDNWADVIGAIDRARTNEWASRNWLEIKTRTVPVTSDENLHEIERTAAISGLTVTDYGVDDDGHPTDATIMGTADDIKLLDQLADHFNAPANVTFPGDADDAPEEIEEEAGDIYDRLVAAWRATANDNLDAILAANGQDAENEPNNVYRAGVFEGLAEAAAWMIYDTITPEDDADDINAIKAAVYRAYGVAI